MEIRELDTLLAPAKTGQREKVVSCRLGRVRYEATWELQRKLQARLIQEKRRQDPIRIPHVLLLLEHDPVYTLGKGGDERNLVWNAARRSEEGVDFVRIDRGGDITFHGPGQLVGYPILDLDRFFTDLHRYQRELEEAVIGVLATSGLEAGRFPGRTGVWLGPDARGPERKICAMGSRVSRWVTMHGFALNVQPRLGFYEGIIPCGIDDRSVTSLALESGAEVDMGTVMSRFEARFAARFDCDLASVDGNAAWHFLSAYLDHPLDADNYLT